MIYFYSRRMPYATRLIYLFLLFFFLPAGILRAQTWYVTATGTGTGSGSWSNAAGPAQLQAIIDAATVGSQVWVAQGTYYPSGVPAGASGAASSLNWAFGLKNGVAVYGGFAGTETALGQRNPATNITELSGDIGVAGTTSDNCYHVVLSVNNNSTAVLDGFTIDHGHASGSASITYGGQTISPKSGAGIYCYASSATIANCVFSNNNASNYGGAMYNVNNSAALVISNCSYSNNKAGLSGGAIYNNNETIVFSGCAITGNTANASSGSIAGGGLCDDNNSNVILLHCFLQADVASSSGTGGGGAIYNNNSALKDSSCIFVANRANNGNGAAIVSSGGSLYNWNCVFVDNIATGNGGAIYNSGSTGQLVNSTLYNNTAAAGAGIYTNTGLNLSNAIVWGNNPDGLAVSTAATVQYSDVQGGYAGTGNISSDPKFVNSGSYAGPDGIWATADDGLQLSYGASPAIDAGINNAAGGFSTTNDIINVARPQMARVDMGAYEAIYLILLDLPPTAEVGMPKKAAATSFALHPTIVSGCTASLLARGIKNAGNVSVTVVDATGRVLVNKLVFLSQGDNTIAMDFSHLPAGIYYCAVSGVTQVVMAFERL